MTPEVEPADDWARHRVRVLELVDGQVRGLRRRQLMGALTSSQPVRRGAFWTIATPVAEYGVPDALPCPVARTAELAQVKTRLRALEEWLQERLINWGYAACDAALRARFEPRPSPPSGFPYPTVGI